MDVDARRMIVGRAAELERVRQLVDRREQGGILVVEGEAGIGKTTLLDVAAARAAERGIPALRATAEDVLAEQPFGLLGRVLVDVDPEAPAVLARIAGSSTAAVDRDAAAVLAQGSTMLTTAIDWALDQLDAVGQGGRVAIVLDDLQWADPLSLLALGSLARRSAGLGVVLVLGLRPSPRSLALDRMLESLAVLDPVYATIGPLSPNEVDVLVELHAGGPPTERLRQWAARAGGNPFYVVDLVGALRDEGRLTSVDGEVDVHGEQMPESLRRTLLRRTRILGDDVGEVLRAAAMLGRIVRLDEVSAVVGRPVAELAEPTRAAVSAGVLVDDGGRLRFRHDLLRESLLEETPPGVRAPLHREVARALTQAGAAPERIAHHLIRGIDGAAPSTLARIREIAASTAPAAAVDLLGAALERCPADEALRGDLAADLAEAMFLASKPRDAERVVCDAMAWDPSPDVLFRLRRARSHARFMLGDPHGAFTSWDELRGGREATSAEAAETALAMLFAADLAGAEERARAALDDPRLDPSRQTVAHGVLAWIDATACRFTEGLHHADASVASFRREDRGGLRGFTPHLFRAVVLDAVGRPEEALDAIAAERQASTGIGSATTTVLHHAALAVTLFRCGRWDEALAECDAGLAASRDEAILLGTGWLVAVKSMVHLHRNDLDAAAAAHDALSIEGFGPQLGQEWIAWSRALIDEAGGKVADAAGMLGAVLDIAAAMGVRAAATYLGPDAARLALGAGDESRVVAVRDQLAWVDGAAPPPIRGAADVCRGLAAADSALLLAGADHLAGVPRPFEEAVARHAAARLLAQAGDGEEARAEAARALDRYDALGATGPALRLRQELRGAGVRIRSAAPARATEGWDSLTKSERAVVAFVAEGLSNAAIADRLYVSRRTVESHLARVYPKLGFSSRMELVRRVAERGGV